MNKRGTRSGTERGRTPAGKHRTRTSAENRARPRRDGSRPPPNNARPVGLRGSGLKGRDDDEHPKKPRHAGDGTPEAAGRSRAGTPGDHPRPRRALGRNARKRIPVPAPAREATDARPRRGNLQRARNQHDDRGAETGRPEMNGGTRTNTAERSPATPLARRQRRRTHQAPARQRGRRRRSQGARTRTHTGPGKASPNAYNPSTDRHDIEKASGISTQRRAVSGSNTPICTTASRRRCRRRWCSQRPRSARTRRAATSDSPAAPNRDP